MPRYTQKTENQPTTAKSVMAGLDLPMAVSAVAAQAWLNMGTELARFALERLQQDIEAQKLLMTCTSLEDLQKFRAQYLALAQAQYAAEAAKLLALMGNVAAAGLVGATSARRYDDVPV